MAIQLGTFEIPRDPTMAWRLHSETGSMALGVPMRLRWMMAPKDVHSLPLFPDIRVGTAVVGSPYAADQRNRRPYMPQLTKTIAYTVRNGATCHLELITAYVDNKPFHILTKVVGSTYVEFLIQNHTVQQLAHAIENPDVKEPDMWRSTRSVVDAIVCEAETRSGGSIGHDIREFIIPLIEDVAVVTPWRHMLKCLRDIAIAAQAAVASTWNAADHSALLASAVRPLIATSILQGYITPADVHLPTRGIGGTPAAVIAPETTQVPDDKSLLLDPIAIVKDANLGSIHASYVEVDFTYILPYEPPLTAATSRHPVTKAYVIDTVVGSVTESLSNSYATADIATLKRVATVAVRHYMYSMAAGAVAPTEITVATLKTRGEEIIATLRDQAGAILGYVYLDLIEAMVFGPSLEWQRR